jgi:hypothetical protein
VAFVDQAVNDLPRTVFADAKRLGYLFICHKAVTAVDLKAGNLGQ